MTYQSYTQFYHYLYIASASMIYLPLFLEIAFVWVKKLNYYQRDHFFSDLGFILIRIFLLTALLKIQLDILSYFHVQSFFQIPLSFPLRLILIFILADFAWYIGHRWMHANKLLWSMHSTHHSIEHLNIVSSFRFNILLVVFDTLTFIPLMLVGIAPLEFLIFTMFILSWQGICHTRFKINFGFLEGIILTPSAHRVHHGKNIQYQNKNFGSFLMIWDHLFGTYEKEVEEPIYGLLENPKKIDPLSLTFSPLIGYFREKFQKI